MQVLLAGVVAIITLWGLAFFAAPLWAWALCLILSFGVLLQCVTVCPLLVYSTLAVPLLFIGFFSCPWLRRRYVSRWFYNIFRLKLPPMSSTEQEAIAAGQVWWEGKLFQGRPDWNWMLQLPKPKLTDQESHFLMHRVDKLCSMIDDWTVSQKDLDLPPEVWSYLKKERFFGMIIPKEYGGLGFSALAHSTIVQKLATHSLTAAITAMVPNSLGPAELLVRYGTVEQKARYLKKLAMGEEIPCFALTSPDAGSDASALTDVGIICEGEYQGKKIIGMKLTWNKRYITLAPIATVLGLAFKLYDPDHLLGTQEELGITVCLIPTDHPGVEIGKRHFPLHQSFMNGPTRGKEVFVPLDWIIGGGSMIGKGWQMLVECLSTGRGISLPALSTASAKICFRTTGAYAKVRKQFHVSIGQFEGVEAAMAQIGGLTYLIEATRLFTLTPIDQQISPAIVSAIAKYHMTEMGRKVVNHAMDIHGGRGIMLGPNNYLARCYESIPISITVEGANILTRNLIIFGQGAIRCHPYIQREMDAMQNPNREEGLKQFDKALWQHFSYTLCNKARAFFHALTGARFCRAPAKTGLKRYYRQLGRLSVALAFAGDVALITLGGKLKRRERLSARLGDVLSHLYLASAVLKYHHDFGHQKEDEPYVEWCLQSSLYLAQQALFKFCHNFPIRILGKALRWTLFPTGPCHSLPSDHLEHQVAAAMMCPSDFRDRLTQQCYLSQENRDPLFHLEQALKITIASEKVTAKLEAGVKSGVIPKWLDQHAKIAKAVAEKVLAPEEAEMLDRLEDARLEAIRVDEFSKEQLTGK